MIKGNVGNSCLGYSPGIIGMLRKAEALLALANLSMRRLPLMKAGRSSMEWMKRGRHAWAHQSYTHIEHRYKHIEEALCILMQETASYSISQDKCGFPYLSSKEEWIIETESIILCLWIMLTLTCNTQVTVTMYMKTWNATVITDILPQTVSPNTIIQV